MCRCIVSYCLFGFGAVLFRALELSWMRFVSERKLQRRKNQKVFAFIAAPSVNKMVFCAIVSFALIDRC